MMSTIRRTYQIIDLHCPINLTADDQVFPHCYSSTWHIARYVQQDLVESSSILFPDADLARLICSYKVARQAVPWPTSPSAGLVGRAQGCDGVLVML
jgi:hypothetical protein